MSKKKRKKGLKVTIDKSFVEEFQARMKETEERKFNALINKFNADHKITTGTRKGIQSIVKKAANRHKAAEELSIKYAEEKKAKQKNFKPKKSKPKKK